jgi:hypothetical protein
MTLNCPDVEIADPRPAVNKLIQDNEGKFQIFMMLAAFVAPTVNQVILNGGKPEELRNALQGLGFTQGFTARLSDPVVKDLIGNQSITSGLREVQIWMDTNLGETIYGGGDPCRMAQFVSFVRTSRALEDAATAHVLHLNP